MLHYHARMTAFRLCSSAFVATLVLLASAGAAEAQDDRPRRTRVGLGPQLVPSYPGADGISLRPFVDVVSARGTDSLPFEAPDESAGFAVLTRGRFAIGPALGFEGSRTARDVGAALPKVGATFEAGGFLQYALTDMIRLRGEVRKGLGGHKGLIANVGGDYVARKGDDWLFSIGPRVTFADGRYHDAFFSVAPAVAVATGLRAFDAKGGLQAAGITAGFVRHLGGRWGVSSYAKYDRLVDDPARSPIVRRYGSRNQVSGGLALTYTFGG